MKIPTYKVFTGVIIVLGSILVAMKKPEIGVSILLTGIALFEISREIDKLKVSIFK